MLEALFAFFMVVGALTALLVGAAATYYLGTRRPTPDATIREAVTSIRWSYAVAFFVLPCAAVGVQEFGGLSGAVSGGAFGGSFVVFMVVLEWWFGPI